jgi:glycosyl transferase family 87
LRETLRRLLKSRWAVAGAYLLLAWTASIQQWSLKRPGDPYTHYNNYVIFRQSFFHLIAHRDLYTLYLSEHWDYFRYSPSFAVAFGAFAWMPDLAGLLLWNTLNAAVLVLGWFALPLDDDRVRLAGAWFVVVELMTALQNAQSNVLIAGLLLMAFAFLERRRVALGALMVVIAAFIKLFGLVAFSLCLLYPEKRRFVLFSALWIVVVGMLPLIVVSPADLLHLYGTWASLLSMDYAESAGLSVMGWLQSWFHLTPPKSLVGIIGVAVFCLPLVHADRYRNFNFRLLFLCNVLIWVVIFNHKAESSTYIIAMCGVGLWYFSRRVAGAATPLDLALVSLAFLFTSLSPTDVFPASLSTTLFVPYAVKAVPCILIWGKVIYDLNWP